MDVAIFLGGTIVAGLLGLVVGYRTGQHEARLADEDIMRRVRRNIKAYQCGWVAAVQREREIRKSGHL